MWERGTILRGTNVGNKKIHSPFALSNIAKIVASRDIRLVKHVALKEGLEFRSSEAKEQTEAKLIMQNNIKQTFVKLKCTIF
jgi:hypothetical protein